MYCRFTCLLVVTCASFLFSLRAAIAIENDRLWVYAPVNFQVDKDVDRLIELLTRAKAAGYNGAAITDYKFGKLDERPDNYYDNLRRTRAAAEMLRIELIPIVMQIGYSNSILQNNPNLAAGLPVRDCDFVIQNGIATIASTQNLLDGGEFETATKNTPSGWDWIDGFGTMTTLDSLEKHSGESSLAIDASRRDESSGGNCRVFKNVKLKPFHQYRFSAWVRTLDLRTSEFKLMPKSAGEKGIVLNHANLQVQPNQDWTLHRVVFNSLQHTDVNVYLGMWDAKSGQAWIDDVSLEEVGGVNLLRRNGCPVSVRSVDGSITYEEGRDYEHWEDPLLGRVPYAGEYSDNHDAPPIRLTKDSRLKEGVHLRVSFYHTVIVHDDQVCSSLVSDEVFELLKAEVTQLNHFLQPKRFFMAHDEIRVAGWDELESKQPTATVLAENVRRCETLIHELCPDAEVLVWSDMFDPHHNARDDYYLVRETLVESWKGLDPKVVIMNWNGGNSAKSLRFFDERGHKQVIAGYYDGDVSNNVQRWSEAANDIESVSGYMYTTWTKNYDFLEAFAEKVRSSN